MIVGVGIDIVELGELDASIVQRTRMRARVFTSAERAYCESRPHPLDHFAARFAAKEAVFKAIGTGWGRGVRWHDAEVVSGPDGRPSLELRGALARHAKRLGARGCHLSLTHSGGYAAAVVVLVG